jgi:zinc transporter
MLTPREIYETFKAGKGPLNSGDFLQRLVAKLNEHIVPVVDQLEEDIDVAEERYAQSVKGYRGEFGALRRRTARIRRYLAPQRDVLERISRLSSSVLSDADRMHIREATDDVTRLLEDLDLARERAMVAQEELTNRLTQQQNDRIYILSLVAAIFLPLSFLTGVFGMNVAGLPGIENPAAFLLVSGAMLGLAVFIVVLFRWRKWL